MCGWHDGEITKPIIIKKEIKMLIELDKDKFEKARDNWLKKLNGRTLAEYANDIEAEQDAKIAKRTPEYLQIWEDAAKRVAAKND